METLEILKRRIDSVEDLRSLVRTMKALAAVSIRNYERAVESLANYSRSIELGLQVALRDRATDMQAGGPARRSRLAAVVFGSDQGMCGQFNEQIAAFAVAHMGESRLDRADRHLLAVGARAAARLEETGEHIEVLLPVPGSVGGITPTVQDILMQIDEWAARQEADHVYLYGNRPWGDTSFRPQAVHLLPVDPERLRRMGQQSWPSRGLPGFTLEWNRLFSALIHQYLFVTLYRATAESLASENASRLASMQAAERNIEEHLEELSTQFHHQRQSSITGELLDVVSGFEALTQGSRERGSES